MYSTLLEIKLHHIPYGTWLKSLKHLEFRTWFFSSFNLKQVEAGYYAAGLQI